MKRQIQIVISLVLILCLSGCGIFRKSTSNKEKYKLEEAKKEDIKVKIDSVKKENVLEKEVDKGIVVTETTETIKQKGEKIKVTKPLPDKGSSVVAFDSIGHKIILKLDSLGQQLEIEVETPDIDKVKTTKTTEHKDRTKESSHDSETKLVKQEAIHREEKRQEGISNSVKTSTPNFWGTLGFYIGLGLLILIPLYFITRKFK